MTCIAYKDGILAADRLTILGGFCRRDIKCHCKKGRNANDEKA